MPLPRICQPRCKWGLHSPCTITLLLCCGDHSGVRTLSVASPGAMDETTTEEEVTQPITYMAVGNIYPTKCNCPNSLSLSLSPPPNWPFLCLCCDHWSVFLRLWSLCTLFFTKMFVCYMMRGDSLITRSREPRVFDDEQKNISFTRLMPHTKRIVPDNEILCPSPH